MTVAVGNAYTDGAPRRGWIVGHFLPPEAVHHSDQVEIKWGVHPAGDERPNWTDAAAEERTTIVILIHGHFTVQTTDSEATLRTEGDYAVYPPGVSHSWAAIEDSVVLTVRWLPTPYDETHQGLTRRPDQDRN